MNQSRVDLATDSEIIDAYNASSDYTNLARKLGYGLNINHGVRVKIKERLKSLKLPLYKKKPRTKLLTKEALFDIRSNYQSARSAIVKDARKVFESSGKESKCVICGYDKHIEIAHLKSVSDFKDKALISEINAPSNLVALCPNHHWELDNGILDHKTLSK